jgi:hypothetical protein
MMTRGVGSPHIAQLALATLICTGLCACGANEVAAPSSAALATQGPGTAISATSPSNPSDKSVTLSWSPPTRNSDGSSLTNLAGYTLHYGTSSQDYTGSIEITDATKTSYTVSDGSFPPGTYYFAVSAYNAQQVSSPLSGEISIAVD